MEFEEIEDYLDASNIFDVDPMDYALVNEIEDGGEEGDEEDSMSDMSSEASSGSEAGDTPTVDISHFKDMVTKLDAILKLLFDHFHNTRCVDHDHGEFADEAHSPHALSRSQFLILLNIFNRIILKTFKSRYTQFLIFWFSSLDPQFTDLFQGLLVSKALFEVEEPVITRAAAASYIASFVSRAQFVDGESARRVVGLLCEFLANELETFSEVVASDGSASVSQFSVFYAVAQAVFLIFCFRWRDFTSESRMEDEMDEVNDTRISSKKWIPALDVIQQAISSPLNPLKVRCSAF